MRVRSGVARISMEDTLLADIFSAYYDARKGKRNTQSQVRFEKHLSDNLISLYRDILFRRYKVGRSICFVFDKPVKREVFAANFRDRVVHHYLFNKLSPIFEPLFIYDSYSCRKNKGTLFGIKRIEHHMKSCSHNFSRPSYVLKLDIQSYFMNIDKEKLYHIICTTLRKKSGVEDIDLDLILYLLEKTIFNDPTKNSYVKGNVKDWEGLPDSKSLFHSKKGCGLPIGNLTSQLFSNIYLNELDQFVKRKLKAKHYGRYVDDFFIISESKEELLSYVPLIRDFLSSELGLQLHPKKIYLQPIDHGVQYLGAFVKPYCRLLSARCIKTMYQSLGVALTEEYNPYVIKALRNSYKGHLSHFKNKIEYPYFAIYSR